MNVLHINQSDISGGAAIAGYRLHQGLLSQGVNSRLLVGQAETDSDLVATVSRRSKIEIPLRLLTQRFGLNHLHLISTGNIAQHKFYQDANVLNFHNLHTGYFNYLAIPALTANKPAVFTLHDMWSFTGHCGYSHDCNRWMSGCGQCPYLDTYPSIQRDTTRLEWKLKDWVYDRSNLTIVALSHWLVEQAKKSMLGRFTIHHIPNGIDTDAYQPLDPEQCRSILGIPTSKKVLLFSTQSLTDQRKGGDLLLKALQILPSSLKAETVLLTLGEGGEKIAQIAEMPTFNLGYVGGDRLKSVAYSAADLCVLPTRADNLPLVLQESMSCGTPMVSFRVGGVPDLVRPGITGYLAEPEDSADLASGIVKLLEDNGLRMQMSQNCRAITLEEYSLKLQVDRYTALYRQVLQS
jgi:glycosyltransferase involved in cell wall biosynthesis